MARIGAALATVLVYSSGAATALLGAAVLRERLGPAQLAAVAACTAGCALVARPGSRPPPDAVGLAAGILSGLAYAAYSLMGRSAARRGLEAWGTVLFTFGFGALALLAGLAARSALASDAPGLAAQLLGLGPEPAGWCELLLLAAGPTVVGFGLYAASLAHLPASVANLLLTTEPAITAALAWAWLGERLTGAQGSGAALILAGVAALRLGEGRAAARRDGSRAPGAGAARSRP